MIHLKDLKSFVHSERDSKTEAILPIITTLTSGMIIILSISPEYLRELNPFTLLLLSVASALPVWAFNQLLWWYFGRKVSAELVSKATCIFTVSDKSKKIISFALAQLMKAIDIMQFIPSKNIANLVTILTIYIGAVVTYFWVNSPAVLYGTIFSLSCVFWLVGLYFLFRTSRKFDETVIRDTWNQLKHNDELVAHINQYFERIEQLVQSELSLLRSKEFTIASDNKENETGQNSRQSQSLFENIKREV